MICGSEIIGLKFKRVTAHFYAVVARLLFSDMIIFDLWKYRGIFAECCGAWCFDTVGGIIYVWKYGTCGIFGGLLICPRDIVALKRRGCNE